MLLLLGGYYTCCGNTNSVLSLEGSIWTSLSSLATSRRGHACAVLGDHVYVMGGSVGVSTEIYSLTSNTWTYGPNLPSGMDHGQGLAYDGSIYFITSDTKVIRLQSDNSGWTDIIDNGISASGYNYPAQIVTDKVLNC